jgi:hypothetical protein
VQRHRTIAAAPVRPATEAWELLVTLLAATLERSEEVQPGSVMAAMSPLVGIGVAAIAGGHFEKAPLTLVDERLHVSIMIATGDAAISADENLGPIPGGASATDDWVLHVPVEHALGRVIAAAIEGAAHLSVEPAPAYTETTAGKSPLGLVDVEAVRRRAPA